MAAEGDGVVCHCMLSGLVLKEVEVLSVRRWVAGRQQTQKAELSGCALNPTYKLVSLFTNTNVLYLT